MQAAVIILLSPYFIWGLSAINKYINIITGAFRPLKKEIQMFSKSKNVTAACSSHQLSNHSQKRFAHMLYVPRPTTFVGFSHIKQIVRPSLFFGLTLCSNLTFGLLPKIFFPANQSSLRLSSCSRGLPFESITRQVTIVMYSAPSPSKSITARVVLGSQLALFLSALFVNFT